MRERGLDSATACRRAAATPVTSRVTAAESTLCFHRVDGDRVTLRGHRAACPCSILCASRRTRGGVQARPSEGILRAPATPRRTSAATPRIAASRMCRKTVPTMPPTKPSSTPLVLDRFLDDPTDLALVVEVDLAGVDGELRGPTSEPVDDLWPRSARRSRPVPRPSGTGAPARYRLLCTRSCPCTGPSSPPGPGRRPPAGTCPPVVGQAWRFRSGCSPRSAHSSPPSPSA